MSLVLDDGKDPVHIPRRDVFEFDDEVAPIFENMAVRSIPMYAEMHRLHARIAAEHVSRGRRPKHVIVDVGASTGVFFKMLAREMGFNLLGDPWAEVNLQCIAVDPSMPMLDQIRKSLSWVQTYEMQGHQIYDELYPRLADGIDIAALHYVLQFIPRSFKEPTLKAIYKSLRKNGLLFLGQKEAKPEQRHKMVDDVIQESYIQFRRDNGYSDEEIALKTKALQNSMWLSSRHSLHTMLYRVGFSTIIETTRWGQFSSCVAVKQ